MYLYPLLVEIVTNRRHTSLKRRKKKRSFLHDFFIPIDPSPRWKPSKRNNSKRTVLSTTMGERRTRKKKEQAILQRRLCGLPCGNRKRETQPVEEREGEKKKKKKEKNWFFGGVLLAIRRSKEKAGDGRVKGLLRANRVPERPLETVVERMRGSRNTAPPRIL